MMLELWARKRPVKGTGYPYEYIFSFENESYCYTALDTLDREIYQEALITKDDRCIMSVEWDRPYTKRKVKQ